MPLDPAGVGYGCGPGSPGDGPRARNPRLEQFREVVGTMTTVTTALTSGSCWSSRSCPKIQIGSVFCALR
jgi:hypothetical protein